jgi:SpoVK/Ycf46/Vps4 family AAA+-type ATPase
LVDTVSFTTIWKDIAGLEQVKQSLQEAAILPLLRPDLLQGLRKPQNCLLYGPPGTGKTMLVRATAHEANCHLFVCTAATLTSKWMGEAEKTVKCLFELSRHVAPSIIFIDEVDALLSLRKSDEHEASRRLKTQVMVQMDGIVENNNSQKNVLILACTNCPWDIDSAVLRRFPRRIYVPLPDAASRLSLFENLLKKTGKHSLKRSQAAKLVDQMAGLSCSDITGIASEASFGPLRSLGGLDAIKTAHVKDVRPVSFGDFESALSRATKSVSEEHLARYSSWQKQ